MYVRGLIVNQLVSQLFNQLVSTQMDSQLVTYLLTFSKNKSGKKSENKKSAALLLGMWGVYLREALFRVIIVSKYLSRCCIQVLFKIFFSILSVVCSHVRATQYFIASVKGSCSWTAIPCDDYQSFKQKKCSASACNGTCPSMGFEADSPKGYGKFYLSTDENDPFCGKLFPPKNKLSSSQHYNGTKWLLYYDNRRIETHQ